MNQNKTTKFLKSILLLGPPNSGKTSLFNWLTGFKHRSWNYPGSTTLLSKGRLLKKYQLPIEVIDSPGLYSLFPSSQDEKISHQSLFKTKPPPLVLLVLDSGKLEVQLPLFFQLQEAGFSPIVVLSMWDLLPVKPNLLKLKSLLKSPVIPFNGLLGDGVKEISEAIKQQPFKKQAPVRELKAWGKTKLAQVAKTCQNIISQAFIDKPSKKPSLFLSKNWDRFFLHPKWGFLFLAIFMFGLFSSIFWLASPFMEGINWLFSVLIATSEKALSASPMLADFVSYGLLASFGSVLVFTPQIFILFMGISLLEDSGYLARGAALMDGPLAKLGLSGRAFVPFLSGYACAVPSVLLARSLKSKRERWMTFFAIPFMTCSARLPVYALLLSFLFYQQSAFKPGLILSLIYILSFVLGLMAVFILNRFLKKEKDTVFLLDLPLYRRPVLKSILQNAGLRTKHYIKKAGPAIFIVALLIWVLSYFPLQPELSDPERIRQSYAGQLGQFMESFWNAMGVDWRVGTALIAAFAAREVFVSALVLVFAVTNAGGDNLSQALLGSMKTATQADGTAVFTTASVTALIVFFMFSLQCLSTTAVVYKESGSFKLASLQFLILNCLAYIMAVIVYQSLNFIL